MEIKISKIKDLTPNQKNVFIKNCSVVSDNGIEEYEIKGKPTKICNSVIKDDTGQIKISAWGFASQFLSGSKLIDVENCFAKEYNREISLSTGFFGRIKKLE